MPGKMNDYKTVIISMKSNFSSFLWVNLRLQQLAAGEVGPGADLGRNAIGTGHLLAHGLGEEESSLERNS